MILSVASIAFLSACSAESKKEFPTSEELLTELKTKNENLVDIQAFTADDDPNEKLGRPGYYISKADFSDSRVEQLGDYLCGGTIETFSDEKDCKKRAEYLNKMNNPELGILSLDQYIYQYDKAIFRVDYDLTAEQAEEYHAQMDEIMAQYQ